MEQTAYEKRNAINIYASGGNLKGLPKTKKNPECIKLVLINKLLNLLKPKCSPSEFEEVNKLIWDIAVASYEHAKGE